MNEDDEDAAWAHQQECEQRSFEDEFWSRVEKVERGCWLWKGRIASTGYGVIDQRGFRGPRAAHRLSWEFVRGTIPRGMFVCHTCDTPACVRPDHLFLGSPKDNMDDMNRKGRSDYIFKRQPPIGEANVKAILTADQVRALREEANYLSHHQLSAKYGVDRSTIGKIVRGRLWRHL